MRPKTDLTANDIRELASRFREIVESYELIAKTMDDRRISSLEIPGIPTLEVTMERLLGNVNSAHRALLRQKSARGTIGSPNKTAKQEKTNAVVADIHAQAEKLVSERDTRRKKKL